MIVSKAFSSSRTSEFYNQFFRPRYEAFQQTVRQTSLVVMLWGPRQRTQLWSNKRLQIRDTLRRMNHAVFFSEQLGVPLSAMTKKGVEFLQSETADLIIALQSAYDVVGAVQHFSEFRVVSSKMLLFIDAAAPDERLYRRALDDMKLRYNNVESYNFPADIVHDNLVIKIVEKVNVMQLVKYCAMQNWRDWRLGSDALNSSSTSPDPQGQPFHYNLLELYCDHRDEIDTLADSAALFLLAYANYVGSITTKALANQAGLGEPTLQGALVPLLRSQMIVQQGDVVSVSGYGRRILANANLVGMIPPPVRAAAPAFQLPSLVNPRSLSVAFAAAMLFFVMLFYWSNTVQQQLPLVYTPTQPAITRVTTTPTPMVTPSPTVRR